MSELQHSQGYHASRVMHHLGKIDLDELREEAEDEEDATAAFRKVEVLYMDIDDAMAAVTRVSD